MTDTYFYIREELWRKKKERSKNSTKLTKYIFRGTTKSFKFGLALYIFAVIWYFYNLLNDFNSLLYWLSTPLPLVFFLITLLIMNKEMFTEQRKIEDYKAEIRVRNQYLNDISDIFSRYKINTDGKIEVLSNEAQERIEKYENKFNVTSNNIVSGVFVSVISALMIEGNNLNSLLNKEHILMYLFTILICWQLFKIIEKMRYSKVYERDKYVLLSIKERAYGIRY